MFYEWFVIAYAWFSFPNRAHCKLLSLKKPALSLILKKFFAAENYICGFNENHAFLSISNHAHEKTDPTHRTNPKKEKRPSQKKS